MSTWTQKRSGSDSKRISFICIGNRHSRKGSFIACPRGHGDSVLSCVHVDTFRNGLAVFTESYVFAGNYPFLTLIRKGCKRLQGLRKYAICGE